jgi:hypothetical protein
MIGRHIEIDCADGDAHPVRAQVTQTEDALPVRDNDEVDRRPAAALQDPVDVGDVLGTDVEPPVPPKDVAEHQAGLPHRGRVDDRDHLFDVLVDEPVEERFVAVEHPLEKDVALQVVRLPPVHLECPLDFELERGYPGPEQAVELQAEPFLFGETRPLVEQRVVENLPAALVNLVVLLARQRVDLDRK